MGSMTLKGEGKAKGTFDIALYHVAVITTGKTQVAVKAENNEKMSAIFAVIKELGIDEKDYKTTGYRLVPTYAYMKKKGKDHVPVLTGYEATNSVLVTVRSFDVGDSLLSEAASAGATEIVGPEFRMSDPQSVIDKAADEAVDKAIANAKRYCKRAGVKYQGLRDLNEYHVTFAGRDRGNRPMMAKAAMAFAPESAPEPAPINPGEDEVSVTINCTFDISNKGIFGRKVAKKKASK